jgi:hypothetical protein
MMNVQQIRALARDRGLKPGNVGKAELIRTIQRQEGNFDCFGRADSNYCDQSACLWRNDCLPTPKKPKTA